MIKYIKNKFDDYMYPIIAIYCIGFILIIGRKILDSIVSFDLESLVLSFLAIVVIIPVLWAFLILFQGLARFMGFDKYIAKRMNNDKYIRKDKRSKFD